MLLSDREVIAALAAGAIQIIPPPGQDLDPELFTSTAVDLTLDSTLLVWEPKDPHSGDRNRIRPHGEKFDVRELLKDDRWTRKFQIDPDEGYEFGQRGQFILGYTQQKICLTHSSRIAARVEGKSSLARLGIGAHVTAPTIHAGIGYKSGEDVRKTAQPIQLEMFNLSGLPVVLGVGMRICQLILEEVREVPGKSYQGQFNEQPLFAPVTRKPGKG